MTSPTLFTLPHRHGIPDYDAGWIAPTVALDTSVHTALASAGPVAFGVSGGKDGGVAAYQTIRYLDAIGHRGKRLLVHSDLGRIEWASSLPNCQALARQLRLELLVVRREQGDMISRWQERWNCSVARYQAMDCVKLIMPWSSAQNRFCTSELKSAIIARGLVEAFPNQFILSVSGIRAEESKKRAGMPISAPNERLLRKKKGTDGLDWNPILAYTLNDVWQTHHHAGLPIHEAYATYGSSRVSCCFCVLGMADWETSIQCPDNHAAYRELVALEIRSGFSFTENRWLGDLRPSLLSESACTALRQAKQRSLQRQRLERGIPPHLLYVEGWPLVIPTDKEAVFLGKLRMQVAELGGFTPMLTDPAAILGEFVRRKSVHEQKQSQKAGQEARQAARAARRRPSRVVAIANAQVPQPGLEGIPPAQQVTKNEAVRSPSYQPAMVPFA